MTAESEFYTQRKITRRESFREIAILALGVATLSACAESVERDDESGHPFISGPEGSEIVVIDKKLPLDENCRYEVASGEASQFSGPDPDGVGMISLIAGITVVDEKTVLIGPYPVQVGDLIGVRLPEGDLPFGLIESISGNKMRFVPVLPEIGVNDCPNAIPRA